MSYVELSWRTWKSFESMDRYAFEKDAYDALGDTPIKDLSAETSALMIKFVHLAEKFDLEGDAKKSASAKALAEALELMSASLFSHFGADKPVPVIYRGTTADICDGTKARNVQELSDMMQIAKDQLSIAEEQATTKMRQRRRSECIRKIIDLIGFVQIGDFRKFQSIVK